MDRSQADAIARAILEPDAKARAELQRKKDAQLRSLADRRRVAVFSLVGMGIGAATAYFASQRLTAGVLWGGIAGSVVGWAFILLHRRSTP